MASISNYALPKLVKDYAQSVEVYLSCLQEDDYVIKVDEVVY